MTPSILEVVLAVLAAIGGGGAVVVALGAWLGKVWSERILLSQKYAGEIDLDLRKRRIESYATLWKATSILPKWPHDDGVTYEQLRELSRELRKWYYEIGGMYLSRTTHDEGYGPLQGAITSVVRDGRTGPLSKEDYEAVRKRCSTLRTLLAADIESRRDSPL
jgi:hypothetical protein